MAEECGHIAAVSTRIRERKANHGHTFAKPTDIPSYFFSSPSHILLDQRRSRVGKLRFRTPAKEEFVAAPAAVRMLNGKQMVDCFF